MHTELNVVVFAIKQGYAFISYIAMLKFIFNFLLI